MPNSKNTSLILITVSIKLLSLQEDQEQYAGDIEEMYYRNLERRGKIWANFYVFSQIIRSLPYLIISIINWEVKLLLNYIKISFRNLFRNRLNSFINITGMAVGLSVCFFILLFVQHELSYDQYHLNKDRIYRVLKNNELWNSPNEKQILEDNFPEIEYAVRLLPRDRMQLQHKNNRFIEDKFSYIDKGFFDLFTIVFLHGSKEDVFNSPSNIVITDRISKKYFGNENPLGKTIRVNNEEDYIVAAVVKEMPDNTHFHFDVFIPIIEDQKLFGKWATNWGWDNFPTYIMLKENTSLTGCKDKFGKIVNELLKDRKNHKTIEYDFIKLTDIHFNYTNSKLDLEQQGNITYVLIFSSIGIFILLIACFNYINLLIANASVRFKEVCVKKVIGVTRRQLMRQFLSEAIVQFGISTIFSLLILTIILPLLNSYTNKNLAMDDLLNIDTISISLLIIGFTTFIAGGLPARFLSSFQPAVLLKGFNNTKGSRFNLRKVFVVVQYSVSISLIIAAGVMLRQINYLNTTNLGYDKENILIFNYEENLKSPKYELLKKELLNNDQIMNVSEASRLPTTDLGNKSYLQRVGADKATMMGIVHTDCDFFKTFNINPIVGRGFIYEMKSDYDNALILNESAVKLLGFEDNPIGKEVFESWQNKNLKVIGVVPDFHFESLYSKIKPIAFVMSHKHCFQMAVKVKSSELITTSNYIKSKFCEIFPEQVFEYQFLNENYEKQYLSDQRTFKLMIFFTILAVIIASIGLLGMITHTAKTRIKEIGIRKVLGASSKKIIYLLTIDYLKWILIAFCIAIPLVYYLINNWLENFAYKINLNILDFIIALMLICFISFATVIWQGIKAASTNPIKSLKYE